MVLGEGKASRVKMVSVDGVKEWSRFEFKTGFGRKRQALPTAGSQLPGAGCVTSYERPPYTN